MRQHSIALVVAVLLATLASVPSSPVAGDSRLARYLRLDGAFTLRVTQAIEIRRDPPIHAGRDLEFDLVLATDAATGAVTVTIRGARTTSTAHGTTQRLGSSHLPGTSFALIPKDGGRRFEAVESGAPAVLLGPGPGDYPLPALMARVLPRLPEDPVGPGGTWTTREDIRSLQGWSWGAGTLTARHEVTGLHHADGSTLLLVKTEGETHLHPGDGETGVSGALKHRARWSFDADHGTLRSMAIDEESEGEGTSPRGSMRFSQVTHIELAPSSGEPGSAGEGE